MPCVPRELASRYFPLVIVWVLATQLWMSAAFAAPAAAARAQDTLTQGKYVAMAADCASCHTTPGGKPYAGGAPLKSPLGTLYGPNITQDKNTGIGNWTKADFEKALRRGIRKDGSYLYPAMPYDAYTKMSAADLDALWVYMQTIPAVANTPPPNTLPFPFTIRTGLAAWQSLYFTPGPFVPVPAKGHDWNRGAYIVQALGHCDDCHTPRNLAQGPETQHRLAGAKIEGWYAPDISNDRLSTVTHWKVDELAHYLKTGIAPGNVKVFGPMNEVVHDSLAYLSAGDLRSMAIYLKDQPNGETEEAVSKAKLPRERLTAGKQIYEDNCSGCHQSNGKGISGSAPALAKNDAVTAGEPYNVIMAMLDGFAPQGSWGAMGSFANVLSDDQIADVANYVRTAWGNDAPPNATPWSVGNWRKNQEVANSTNDPLLCPNLPQDITQPAMKLGSQALKRAADNRDAMNDVVGRYYSARPKSSTAEVIEALSTAYCRTLADDHLSQSRMTGQISSFAQQVAVAASAHGAADGHNAKT